MPGIDNDANNDVTTELEDTKIVVPLKNLSNFIFCLDFLMINTEIELILKCSPNCVLTQKVTRPLSDQVLNQDGTVRFNEVPAINRPKGLKFNIIDCRLYVPVVTLQEKYDNELLEGLKNGININFEWGRYRTQIINQAATSNLNFLINPTFNNVNGLFVLAFPNEENRNSFIQRMSNKRL